MSKKTKIPKISLEVGDKLFQISFGGKEFHPALLELIKNSVDWGATQIHINVGNGILEITDDGKGMDNKNLKAFASAALTSGNQKTQMSKFGTGSKMMLYLAYEVEVFTVTEESGYQVINFSINTDDYQRMALAREKIQPKVVDSKFWGMDFETGTRLVYKFKKNQSVPSEITILNELSRYLPHIMHDLISVNGQRLPEKKIKGNMISEETVSPELGFWLVEIYRDQAKSRNSGITLTSTGVPEVRFANFYRLLPEEIKRLIPSLYLNQAEITGIIQVKELFTDYINEDRQTFNPEILQDKRIIDFIKLLQQKEPEFRKILELKDIEVSEGIDGYIEEMMKKSKAAYGDSTPTATITEQVQVDKGGYGTETESKALKIFGTKRQYQIGEKVELLLKLDENQIDPDGLITKWLTINSGLKQIKTSNLKLTGIADSKGFQQITVKDTNSNFSAVTSYEIVTEKTFYLSASSATIPTGVTYKLTGYNVDLIDGKIEWSYPEKESNLIVMGADKKGGSATFSSNAPGVYKVTASGQHKDGGRVSSSCEITVVRSSTPVFNIEGISFKIIRRKMNGERIVTMIPTAGDEPEKLVHTLELNEHAALWSMPSSAIGPILFYALAYEFARFMAVEIRENTYPRKQDLDSGMTEFEIEAQRIFEKMFS